MKITVTEFTDDVETHKMVVETDKASISRAAGEYVQQRVRELDLALDYCLYLTPEGKQVKFLFSLELTKDHLPSPPEGCPTDEEMQLMQDAADQEQEERDAWYAKHGMGKDWEASRDQEHYLSTHLVAGTFEGWGEGRGYD